MVFIWVWVDFKDVLCLWKVLMYYFFDFYIYLDNLDVVLFM